MSPCMLERLRMQKSVQHVCTNVARPALPFCINPSENVRWRPLTLRGWAQDDHSRRRWPWLWTSRWWALLLSQGPKELCGGGVVGVGGCLLCCNEVRWVDLCYFWHLTFTLFGLSGWERERERDEESVLWCHWQMWLWLEVCVVCGGVTSCDINPDGSNRNVRQLIISLSVCVCVCVSTPGLTCRMMTTPSVGRPAWSPSITSWPPPSTTTPTPGPGPSAAANTSPSFWSRYPTSLHCTRKSGRIVIMAPTASIEEPEPNEFWLLHFHLTEDKVGLLMLNLTSFALRYYCGQTGAEEDSSFC